MEFKAEYFPLWAEIVKNNPAFEQHPEGFNAAQNGTDDDKLAFVWMMKQMTDLGVKYVMPDVADETIEQTISGCRAYIKYLAKQGNVKAIETAKIYEPRVTDQKEMNKLRPKGPQNN